VTLTVDPFTIIKQFICGLKAVLNGIQQFMTYCNH